MITPQVGWGSGPSGYWRTTNGGYSWTALSQPPGRVYDFVSANEAVTATGEPGAVSFEWTADGGQHWISRTLNIPAANGNFVLPEALSFSTPTTGWLLVEPEQGMNSDSGWLYQTTNAGASWTLVASASIGGTLPSALGTLSFSATGQGWLLASSSSTTTPRLYQSSDGGVHWVMSAIASPQGYYADPLALPTVEGSRGTMVAGLANPPGVITHAAAAVFQTVDGGRSWKEVGQSLTLDNAIAAPMFATPEVGFAPVQGALLATSNGGISWTRLGLPTFPAGSTVQQIDLLGTQDVWLVLTDSAHGQLMAISHDGGKSWTVQP